MAEVIAFPGAGVPRCEGNGAREALIVIFQEHACDSPDDPDAIESADVVLMKLFEAGFKVVPIDG